MQCMCMVCMYLRIPMHGEHKDGHDERPRATSTPSTTTSTASTKHTKRGGEHARHERTEHHDEHDEHAEHGFHIVWSCGGTGKRRDFKCEDCQSHMIEVPLKRPTGCSECGKMYIALWMCDDCRALLCSPCAEAG